MKRKLLKTRSTGLFGLGAIGLALAALVSCAPPWEQQFSSNGQRIYSTATTASGQSISHTGGPTGGMMGQSNLTCISCHGQDGHGGTVSMMMETFKVPNITWPVLTGEDPDMEHPPYTEDTLKRAITEGVDSGGSN